MSRKSAVDSAWETLFERHKILERVLSDGSFRISSAEINQVKEARLMAKFDQSFQLPEIFRSNGLSILPVTRGEYVIGPYVTHFPVTYSDVPPVPMSPPDLQTLDSTNLYSEAAALLFCYNSGIIHDFFNTRGLSFTVNGRMSSGEFDFRIQCSGSPPSEQALHVNNAQIEIDAGYESPEFFCICEAKNVAVEELLIRQLYYPYRLWSEKITKPVYPLFLVFSNDIFHLFLFRFGEQDAYHSIRRVCHRASTFVNEQITHDDAVRLWQSITPSEEPEAPFPQADNFSRIVDLISVLYERDLTRDEVTLKYEFASRQTDYYLSACQYLGLVERPNGKEESELCRLTASARKLLRQKYKNKYLALMEAILQRPVFYDAFRRYLTSGELPDKRTICQIMDAHQLGLNAETTGRRSSTVRNWIAWILTQCGNPDQLTLDSFL